MKIKSLVLGLLIISIVGCNEAKDKMDSQESVTQAAPTKVEITTAKPFEHLFFYIKINF